MKKLNQKDTERISIMKRTFRHFLSLVISLIMLVSMVWIPKPLLADDPTPPTIVSAEITTTQSITLTFDKDMKDPFGLGGSGFSYTINGVSQTVNSISYSSSNPKVYVLELHAGIQPGNTVTLSYVQGGNPIQSADGGILASFSNMALTNNLDTTAPTIFVITTQDDNNNANNDGTYLSVSFNLPMADPPAVPGGFTVTVNGTTNVTVTEIYRKPSFNKSYILRLGTAIQYGQEVRLSYTPGTVQSIYGVAMAADSNHYVNNQMPQPMSADLTNIVLSGSPANFTFSGSTYTYNNVTVANDVAGITVTPTGAGTITVDETAVASGNASGEIALTAGVERTILVKTTEAGKATKTYTIKVTRAQPPATIPSAPQNLVATPGDEQVILSWVAPADNGGSAITKYKVSNDNGLNWIDTSDTGYTFTGLTNGVTYTFQVLAVNNAGDGTSATVTATPQATSPPDLDYIPRTLTDPATGITVSGSLIHKNAVLMIGAMNLGSDEACNAIRQHMNNDDYTFLLGNDISLSEGFIGTLTIMIPVDAQYNGQTVTILHSIDGMLQTYAATAMDGKAVFNVTSLSPFAIFVQAAASSEDEPATVETTPVTNVSDIDSEGISSDTTESENTSNDTTTSSLTSENNLDDIPKTSDNGSSWVWWLLCSVSAVGIVTLIVLSKRKKEYKC